MAVLRRHFSTFLLAAMAAGSIGMLAFTIPRIVGADDGGSAPEPGGAPLKAGDPPGKGEPLASSPVLAGKVMKLTTTQYINFDVEARRSAPEFIREAGDHIVTESWTKMDADGTIAAYRNISRDEDGNLAQDQYFDGASEHINWYGRPGSGSNCRTDTAVHYEGGPLPVVTDARSESLGFTLVDVPPEAAAVYDRQDVRAFEKEHTPGHLDFPRDRQVVIVQNGSDYQLGRLTYGISSDGTETLLEFALSVVNSVDDVFPDAAFEPLQVC